MARRGLRRIMAWCWPILLVFPCALVFAHGGLTMDEDYCKLRVGRYVMHFTGYQPDSPRAAKEFCEDIPETGNTVIVLDYIDDELRDLPTELRIIKSSGDESDLDAITLLHLPPKRYPTGSLSVSYRFDEPGSYVGLVTVGEPPQAVSRFPFSVGRSHYGVYVQLGALAVLLGLGLYWLGQRQRERGQKASLTR